MPNEYLVGNTRDNPFLLSFKGRYFSRVKFLADDVGINNAYLNSDKYKRKAAKPTS